MRKLIAITLSLLMVFTTIPMAIISASAETFDKTLITFDNAAERTVVTHNYDYNHWVKEVEGFGTGNSAGLNMPSGKGNSLQIRLTPGWKAYQPTAIKFLIKNSESMGNPILKVGFGATAAAASTYSQGLTITATSEADWASVSLEGLDISEFDYISIGKPSVNATIYVDDITLVCPTSALAEGRYEWNTLEDFESGIPETLTTSAKPVTVTASTEVATGTVTASTASVMAKTSGWNEQNKKNYLTLSLDTAKTATADDIKVFAKAEANNVNFFGVVIDDTTYWRKNLFTKTWSQFYVLDEVFTSETDSSSKTFRSADISKITALKFSFTQNTNYGTNLYIDDIEYAQFKEATPAPVEPSPATMKSGAAIRLNEQNGIRFYTTVDAEKLTELKAVEGNVVEFGTLIAPADLVTGELTHSIGEDNYVDVPYKNDTYFEDTTFVGSIVGIKPGNIGRKFIGRGYIKVTNGETETYYYATQNDNERSLKSVAASYQGTDDYNSKTDEVKELVDAWALAADWSAQ